MQRQTDDLGVEDFVRFHGFLEYAQQFIAELASYDLLLFLPTEEDTPQMLYDAVAPGLPLVGSRIPFLLLGVASDKMGVLVDVGGSALAGERLCRLNADRRLLMELSRAALGWGATAFDRAVVSPSSRMDPAGRAAL